jgi:hypothetical protein
MTGGRESTTWLKFRYRFGGIADLATSVAKAGSK